MEKQRNQDNGPSEGFSLTSSIPKCQILGLTRGSGILHIESMLVNCNMWYMEVGAIDYPLRNKEIKITDLWRDLA